MTKVWTAVGGVLLAGVASPQDAVELEAGPLTMKVHVSRTAHLFHVVDQIAAWSPYCHGQYRRWLEGRGGGLDEDDLEQLGRHAAVRAERGWGAGLEQTFYSPLDLGEAIDAGVAAGHITRAEGRTEREVLLHFADRVDALLEDQAEVLSAFRERLSDELPAVTELARTLSRFCGGVEPDVPVYLIANPHERDCGGGFNGGRLTLEIPSAYDVYPTFLHEVLHSFVATREEKLRAAVEDVPGLDYETLNEGIAYALAPGMIRPEGAADELLDRVARDAQAKKGLDDPYVRFNRFGLALRPLLEDALADPEQKIDAFLPRAVDAWRVLAVLDAAWTKKEEQGARYRAPGAAPSVFVLSNDRFDEVAARFEGKGCHRFGRPHTRAGYAEAFDHYTKEGDAFVLVIDHSDPTARVPAGFEDLLPRSWASIEKELARGRPVELGGEARGLDVVLLAAPEGVELSRLIRETGLLADLPRGVR